MVFFGLGGGRCRNSGGDEVMPFDLRHYANILRLLRLLRATCLVIDPGFFQGKRHETVQKVCS